MSIIVTFHIKSWWIDEELFKELFEDNKDNGDNEEE